MVEEHGESSDEESVGGIKWSKNKPERRSTINVLEGAAQEVDQDAAAEGDESASVRLHDTDPRVLATNRSSMTGSEVWMQPGRGAVIEAFPPQMLYGTGFTLSNACDLLHLPLLLHWRHADLSPLTDPASLRRSALMGWHEKQHKSWKQRDFLLYFRRECVGRRPASL